MNNLEFIPIERYPNRCALDIVDNIMEYIKDKVVCDIGCGAGDLLEYMKLRNLCKEVKGIEIDPNRYVCTYCSEYASACRGQKCLEF